MMGAHDPLRASLLFFAIELRLDLLLLDSHRVPFLLADVSKRAETTIGPRHAGGQRKPMLREAFVARFYDRVAGVFRLLLHFECLAPIFFCCHD